MADETQNAVAGTQTATEENATQEPTKMYVYYYSNPDGVTKEDRCHTIYSEVPFTTLPWHVHDKKPADGMEDPVWDTKLNNGLGDWKENSGTVQSQILAEATQKIAELDSKSEQLDAKSKELDEANDKVDQAVKAMQQVQAQSSQQTVAMMKSFTEQTQNTNKMLATMQQTLAMVVKAVQNSAVSEAPAQPSTNEQENGGN